MHSKAIILFGAPGSGKGQQADLLADSLGVMHIDTGKLIRAILASPEAKSDPVLRKEKELNDAGILNTPSWVVDVLSAKVSAVAKLGYGIVFSGSPRTLYETERVIPLLETLYGKEGIHIFYLNVPLEVAAERNKHRVICSICRRPLLMQYYPSDKPTHCPICAGPLERRTDDDPAKFATRTKEYAERTRPGIEFVRNRGYQVVEVDGAPAPYRVFKNIISELK